MSLSPGSRLGPYEIVATLGAGGMGEVYRARDSRLGREVAVKVLPGDLSSDQDRVRRFEQEARSASALDHPNIITIYDIGSADETLYIAMQYVEGKTLRELLSSSPLPTKKVLEISVQIAEGLAKAHAAGIIHRDLKPENVMVSKDGFVKILDFGLAKLTAPQREEQVSELLTAMADTRPGMVMGTVGYMSPEQASGQALDFRSDQFSFGSILYELSTGKRAFQRGTTAETLTAIIREEPESVGAVNPRAPAPLRWIVERCLAKDPDERFGTTRDLARDLASIRDHLSDAVMISGEAQAIAPLARRMPLWPFLVGAGLLAATALVSFSLGRKAEKTQPPSFRQLTFRRGTISSARFAPDGKTVLYGASLEGKPTEIFVSRPESPESRPFGMPEASVLAVSKSGEMALSLGQHIVGPFMASGTLARMSVAGGAAPREILEDVQWADWAPDGATLAIVREAAGRNRLEFPIGKVLLETAGWISHMRVSPRGDEVAYIDHPARGDDGGLVAVVDRSGKRRSLSESYESAQGLAWAPEGGEVWFTGAKIGSNRALYAVNLSGRQRLVARAPGVLTLHDVSRGGSVLMTRDTNRQELLGRSTGELKERDLTWLDWSNASDISADGKLLFSEAGEGAGAGYSVYVRRMDGAPAVRLGEGSAQALSPDGKWALAITRIVSEPQIVLYPTGVGETRTLPREGLVAQSALWLPDGKQILVTASEAGHGSRLYLWDLSGGKPRAISPEGYRSFPRGVSPDGKLVAVRGPDQRLYLYPVAGGEPSVIPGLTPEDTPTAWSADGRFLYVYRRRELPAKVYRLDVATGRKELWRELMPFDAAGVRAISPPLVTPDGKSYAYAYIRTLSDLYLVEGVK